MLMAGATFITGVSHAQTYTGQAAKEKVSSSKELYYHQGEEIPAFVQLDKSQAFPSGKFQDWAKKAFHLDAKQSLELMQTNEDKLGFSHQKYQQKYNGIPVEDGVYILHTREGKVISMNGHLAGNLSDNSPAVTEKLALKNALKYVGATTYRWEVEKEEAHIKLESGNPDATYQPEGHLVYIKPDQNKKNYQLAYKFDIYALKPLKRAYVYVDAQTGDVLRETDRICHIGGKPHVHDEIEHQENIQHTHENQVDASGTAETMYSGSQEITTDSYENGYRLRESGRGSGIETYNMQNSTSHSEAVDFTNSTNHWNTTTNYENAAYDAHWGAEITYDYFYETFNRNSFDGNGAPMLSYVHYGVDYDNAFWDGTRMTYGDGSNSSGGFTPLTAMDVVAHEFTHGLTEYTAGLIYSGESGALNESFSDIFGTVIEFYAKPGDANYLIGEQLKYDGGSLRSMSDPGIHGNPDTYEGSNWVSAGSAVHTNSGVSNYWFYLVSEGGSGTNDHGNSYSVDGIGIEKAANIAYRNLTTYLTPGSNYDDARYYAIRSAVDLYGACSPEVEAVASAWHAVGVGDPYVPEVTANFTVRDTAYCRAPATVPFKNETINANEYSWDFGDGSTSTEMDPEHTYEEYGTYTVSLSADGGECGTDNVIKSTYIVVDSDLKCITRLPESESGPLQTSCEGIIYDNGGAEGDYSNNTSGSVTIEPEGASAIILSFDEFEYEQNFDYLRVYDGTSVNDPLIGEYSGTSLPEGGEIVSSNNAVTVQQITDGSVVYSGFSAEWTCISPDSPPLTNFSGNPVNTCDGIVNFEDGSVNAPDSWEWDFGDGTTSEEENPSKTYTTSGVYDITLTTCNEYGCDTKTRSSYISVNLGELCAISIPSSSNEVHTSCEGLLQDDGGDGQYSNNTNGSVTIAPDNAISVSLSFNSFSFEEGWDYLYVFDGPTTSDDLIGVYSGNNLPEGGTINSTGGAITVQQITDGSVTTSGFEAEWTCISADSPPVVRFSATPQNSCNGIVEFTDQSINATSWEWDFGDGTTSQDQYPEKTYDVSGTYTVTLSACNENGCNERIKTDYITVSLDGLCPVTIPESGNEVQTSCSGTLMDNGGTDDYSNSIDGSVTIAPENAEYITLTFSSFSFESNYDYLYVYDGASTSSPLIGRYSGSSLPNGGQITSSGGALTIVQTTDGSVVFAGFEADWVCEEIDLTPEVDFSASPRVSCDGNIQFTDQSGNEPDSWEWDFGDGTTSQEQHPEKVYSTSGTYTVTLNACNEHGCNEMVMHDYITVNLQDECDVLIPESGNETYTSCSGEFLDNGGIGDYYNSTDGSITIAPENANVVSVTFNSFFLESNFDYVYIYDGSSTSSPLIGRYSGNSLEGEEIFSSGEAITIRQTTDGSVTYSGFEAEWSCIGPDSPPVINFSASPEITCDGIVSFTDESVNATSWEWNFGDGTTSQEQHPEKVYSTSGTYTVTLNACNENGCTEQVMTDYITVSLDGICDRTMPSSGNDLYTHCSGSLLDNGGTEDYSNNTNGSVTIAPENAASVTLTFNSFSFESNFDYLYVYDGASTTSPLIGRYSGSTLPEGGQITSSGGAITIRQTTDGSVLYPGFELQWECEEIDPRPDVDFSVSSQVSCDGNITFTDESGNEPDSWEWNFGDGSTSQEQHPEKVYNTSGTYTITLVACNEHGCNELVMTDHVSINLEGDCDILMPETGNDIYTQCSGSFFDNGGTNDYSNNTNGSITIAPENANSVTVTFNSFSFENGYDTLFIYDGASTSSPLIGTYTGTTLPGDGVITSSDGAITLRQQTDEIVPNPGFEAVWQCDIITDLVIGEPRAEQLRVYPNPTQDETTIDYAFNGQKDLRIYVMNPLQVAVFMTEGTYENGYKHTLSTTSLSGGFYYIYIEDGDNVHIEKLIIH